MRKLFIVFVAILSMAMYSSALAKNITITGVGITENAATNDALRCAVEQAVGVLIDSETIIDKNVVIPPHTKIGFDREEDIKRGFHVSAGGVTVVPKGAIL